MDKKTQTIQTYDQNAAGMARKFANVIKARTVDLDRFFDLIENKDNPLVVEIGCGNGREAVEILKVTKNFIGVDVSKGMLELAKERLPEAKFELADVEGYQFPENLDGVVAFASLLHSDYEQIKGILSRAAQKLVRGGIFYISLKKGVYNPEGDLKVDEFGSRTFYFYDLLMIEEVGEDYEVVYKEEQHLSGQDWFIIVLKKK
ncbi:MAG: class I SAM-dependent methyltransferase [Candidatus Altimarinota bacterium]